MLSIWEARSFFKYSEHVESNTINKEHELPVSLVTIGTITILNAIAIHFLVSSLANIFYSKLHRIFSCYNIYTKSDKVA